MHPLPHLVYSPGDMSQAQPFGERFKALRLQLGWSQTDAAKALDTTSTTISRWETGTMPLQMTRVGVLVTMERELAKMKRRKPPAQ